MSDARRLGKDDVALKILLVEDSPTQALRTRLTLDRLGYEVLFAPHGKAALEVARSERPDAILSDILMPAMDGFQLCLELRQDPALRWTPVILQTASFHSEDDRTFAMRVGADAFVNKDLPPEMLHSVLTEAVSRSPRPAGGASHDLLDERSFRSEYGERVMSKLAMEAAQLKQAHDALTAAYDSTLAALVMALDVRDTDTELHSWRVTEYARGLAMRMDLDGDALDDLVRGSLLHDIGKIGIPDHILKKPAALDEREWAEMRRHPELGDNILADIDFLSGARQVVCSHHERWDGNGYPRGLAKEDIPLAARIFSVADTIDAITSDRPYRSGRPFETALQEIERLSGRQFCPSVVDVATRVAPSEWTQLRARADLRPRKRTVAVA